MSQSTPFFPPWRAMLAPLGRRSSSSMRCLRQATLSQIEERFAPALPASLFELHPSGPHSRERIFTLSRTVWGWLWQVLAGSAPCREVVRQVQALFAMHEAGFVDEGTSGFCQSRINVLLAFLEDLFKTSFQSAERAAPQPVKALLQNRPVRVVDGSGARLWDNPKNRAAYPPSANLPEGTGFPLLRMAVLFSLASGALLAQASGSILCGEWSLWHSLLSALRPGDILLGDRAYGHYVVAALLQSVGVDLIASVPARLRKIDFRRTKKRFGRYDGIFVWTKPQRASAFLDLAQWNQLPSEITVRLLRISLTRHGFPTQHIVLVTTLLDPVLYPGTEIAATHVRRWRLEMCLDDLKTTLGMEQLSCRSPQMVQKELLVYLTAYNLMRWLMAQAADRGRIDLECISFKGSLDAFRQWSQAIAQSRQRHRRFKLWLQLLDILVADALPFRPGRQEPRAVKRRSKYPHLSKPRKQYNPRWSRNKRRRMANHKSPPLN